MKKVLSTEVERDIQVSWLLHKVLFTTNLFRMASKACHTRQVMIANDVWTYGNLIYMLQVTLSDVAHYLHG